ncbi:MAG: 3-isopropylmalate dehydratase small subunit [Patescibacteria group bacterium]|nr:3-isopropylmalate dehydratase small subunit [Patescibacteria group bacterium]
MITEPDHDFCGRVANSILADDGVAHPTSWKNGTKVEKPDYAKLRARIVSGKAGDFSGTAFYLPKNNVDTDQIIPAKYLNQTDKAKFGEHCLEDAVIPVKDRPKLYQSRILVAGENFGCGSSREHAPWALEAAGIRCVIAPSFARIFENNMIANGLLCVVLPKEKVDELFKKRPPKIAVCLEEGEISWDITMSGSKARAKFPVSDYQKELIRNGGSVGYMINLASELVGEGKL